MIFVNCAMKYNFVAGTRNQLGLLTLYIQGPTQQQIAVGIEATGHQFVK